MPITPTRLVEHFTRIYRERMRCLPIVNERLAVEAVGFRQSGMHEVGVLMTPWFMNLVLLPGTSEWDSALPGSEVEYEFPGEPGQFIVNRDDTLGIYLSTILFRTMSDFPDQDLARAVAGEILERLFTAPDQPAHKRTLSRRALFSSAGAG